jgi:hypothetical protein
MSRATACAVERVQGFVLSRGCDDCPSRSFPVRRLDETDDGVRDHLRIGVAATLRGTRGYRAHEAVEPVHIDAQPGHVSAGGELLGHRGTFSFPYPAPFVQNDVG